MSKEHEQPPFSGLIEIKDPVKCGYYLGRECCRYLNESMQGGFLCIRENPVLKGFYDYSATVDKIENGNIPNLPYPICQDEIMRTIEKA